MNKNNLFISSFKENLKFIIKILIFALMVIGYFNHVMPQYEGKYTASLIDKVERLTTIHEPKIVLLGNSNLAFGMNSEMIENEFGMPVVNMGLHGGLGNEFHEEMAKLNVVEGDIYILCHTEFVEDQNVDNVLMWVTIENHYKLWDLLRFSDIYPMIKAYPTYLKNCLDLYVMNAGNVDDGTLYARSAFNEYGDIAGIRTDDKYTFDTPVAPMGVDIVVTERINKLNNWLESRGAILLVAGYPIGKGELTVDEKEYISFQEELEAQLECPVISDYTDYMFGYNYFYDTDLHLKSEGADMRTRLLIEDIKKWLSNCSKLGEDND